MAIKCFFISSPATTKVQNGIKRRRGTLPPLILRPFENVLAMRGASTPQGRITEQRDGGICKEVWEPSSTTSFHLNLLNASRTIRFCSPRSFFHPSRPPRRCCCCCFVSRWVSAEGQQQTWLAWAARAGRGTSIHQEEVKCNRGGECKVDKWLITPRNEMIHHFLKLSSLKDHLSRYISVSRSWCLQQTRRWSRNTRCSASWFLTWNKISVWKQKSSVALCPLKDISDSASFQGEIYYFLLHHIYLFINFFLISSYMERALLLAVMECI